MSVTTKKGDRGRTITASGRRVRKDSLRMETCGTLDELMSAIGLAESLLGSSRKKRFLSQIQSDVSAICCKMSASPAKKKSAKKAISAQDTLRLEKEMERLIRNERVSVEGFVMPGGTAASAAADLARAIARRAERRVVAFVSKRKSENGEILRYMNRLSDFLFILARSLDRR